MYVFCYLKVWCISWKLEALKVTRVTDLKYQTIEDLSVHIFGVFVIFLLNFVGEEHGNV